MGTERIEEDKQIINAYFQPRLAKVKDIITNGGVPYIDKNRHKAKIDHFHIEKGRGGYGHFLEEIVEKKLDYNALDNLLVREVLSGEEYQSIVSHLAQGCRKEVGKIHNDLNRLCIASINEIKNEDFSALISKNVNTLILELNELPIHWTVAAWTTGIWPIGERIEIPDVAIIRKINQHDMEDAVENNYHHEIVGSKVIIEFVIESVELEQPYHQLHVVLSALRLFRVGGITAEHTEYNRETVAHPNRSAMGGFQLMTDEIYDLTPVGALCVKRLYERIKDAIPKDERYYGRADKPTQISISLQRYCDALTQYSIIEGRITTAVSCLESLYYKKDEKDDITTRLSLRAAALLRLFGFNPLRVVEDVRSAYRIRSTFTHGSVLNEKQRKDVPDLLKRILDYARVTLLIHLQKPIQMDKDSLIKRLDDSLVDDDTRKNLTNDFQKMNLVIPIDKANLEN